MLEGRLLALVEDVEFLVGDTGAVVGDLDGDDAAVTAHPDDDVRVAVVVLDGVGDEFAEGDGEGLARSGPEVRLDVALDGGRREPPACVGDLASGRPREVDPLCVVVVQQARDPADLVTPGRHLVGRPLDLLDPVEQRVVVELSLDEFRVPGDDVQFVAEVVPEEAVEDVEALSLLALLGHVTQADEAAGDDAASTVERRHAYVVVAVTARILQGEFRLDAFVAGVRDERGDLGEQVTDGAADGLVLVAVEEVGRRGVEVRDVVPLVEDDDLVLHVLEDLVAGDLAGDRDDLEQLPAEDGAGHDDPGEQEGDVRRVDDEQVHRVDGVAHEREEHRPEQGRALCAVQPLGEEDDAQQERRRDGDGEIREKQVGEVRGPEGLVDDTETPRRAQTDRRSDEAREPEGDDRHRERFEGDDVGERMAEPLLVAGVLEHEREEGQRHDSRDGDLDLGPEHLAREVGVGEVHPLRERPDPRTDHEHRERRRAGPVAVGHRERGDPEPDDGRQEHRRCVGRVLPDHQSVSPEILHIGE